MFVCCECCVL